ncbi:hypothetical protein F01_450076 [Burkholderia cenocepacia]|nr:hypothetical protein F01_450076 [Burkholderia cenocepacia]
MRRVYRASRRCRRAFVRAAGRRGRGPQDHDDRSRRRDTGRPQGPAGLARARRRPVRLLPVGAGDGRYRADRIEPEPERRRHRRGHGRQHLPLRHVQPDSRRGQASREGGLTCREDSSKQAGPARACRAAGF